MVRGAVVWQDPMQRYRLHDLLYRNILSCDLGSKGFCWLVFLNPSHVVVRDVQPRLVFVVKRTGKDRQPTEFPCAVVGCGGAAGGFQLEERGFTPFRPCSANPSRCREK